MPEVYKGISVCDWAVGVPDGVFSDTLHGAFFFFPFFFC